MVVAIIVFLTLTELVLSLLSKDSKLPFYYPPYTYPNNFNLISIAGISLQNLFISQQRTTGYLIQLIAFIGTQLCKIGLTRLSTNLEKLTNLINKTTSIDLREFY